MLTLGAALSLQGLLEPESSAHTTEVQEFLNKEYRHPLHIELENRSESTKERSPQLDTATDAGYGPPIRLEGRSEQALGGLGHQPRGDLDLASAPR